MSWRSSASRSGEIPRSPRRTSMGSPGTSRIIVKVTNINAKKVGSVSAARFRKNRNIQPPYKRAEQSPMELFRRILRLLFGYVHVLEFVGAERAYLVARNPLRMGSNTVEWAMFSHGTWAATIFWAS